MITRTKGQYFGERRLELDRPGLVLSAYDYHDPETVWHYHENPYFMYVLHGDMFEANKQGKTAIGAGSLVFHNWQEPHQNLKSSKTAAGFHVELERSWLQNLDLQVDLWEGSQIVEHPRLHHLIAKLFLEFQQLDGISDLTVELLLVQLCDGAQEERASLSQHQPPWVNQLRDILHDPPEQLSLQWLSEELGVHPVHLSRAIPKYLSIRLGDYLRQQKIRKAIPLLLDPDLSLTEVSYKCGFSDQSHFNRICKNYLNCTPGNFRKRSNIGRC